jgi:hypothetical protein
VSLNTSIINYKMLPGNLHVFWVTMLQKRCSGAKSQLFILQITLLTCSVFYFILGTTSVLPVVFLCRAVLGKDRGYNEFVVRRFCFRFFVIKRLII